ncbi:helix-turn-helix domain-containing protein [Chitinivibrio alkaliphilus]|uniref:Transcriptional regulator, AraC family n=1 Tax=Chitinivibrio alkaliphilus ACht1 TaxID=1313304 RepID=U7DB70_9BACT|nr:helix-turn-helix domain-containing protein [Chitinivibrio alkaliphilus]ERP38793.1 transcriptional regulator, AraC family [Chitinivibrio alkaliphilus ACht1]
MPQKQNNKLELLLGLRGDTFSPNDTITFYIDHENRSAPYPDEELTILQFTSLTTTPQAQLVNTKIHRDSLFTRTYSSVPLRLTPEIHTARDEQRFTLKIPPMFLGGEIPEKFGLNILIGREDSHLSLVSGAKQRSFAPATFPVVVQRQGRSITIAPLHALGISFFAGALLALLWTFLEKKYITFLAQKNHDNPLYHSIVTHIDAHVVTDSLNVDTVARKFHTSAKTVNRACLLLRQAPFSTYVLTRRLQVAKERLISSYSSEVDIAHDCRFSSIAEMEQIFHRHVGKAPYQFREIHKTQYPF